MSNTGVAQESGDQSGEGGKTLPLDNGTQAATSGDSSKNDEIFQALNVSLSSIANGLSRLNDRVGGLEHRVESGASGHTSGGHVQAFGSPFMNSAGLYMTPEGRSTANITFSDLSAEEKKECCARERQFLDFLKDKIDNISEEKLRRYIKLRVAYYDVANISDFVTARAVFEVSDSAIHPQLLMRLRQFGWTGTPRPKNTGLETSTGYPNARIGSGGGNGFMGGAQKPGRCLRCGGYGHWANECTQERKSITKINSNSTSGVAAPEAAGER